MVDKPVIVVTIALIFFAIIAAFTYTVDASIVDSNVDFTNSGPTIVQTGLSTGTDYDMYMQSTTTIGNAGLSYSSNTFGNSASKAIVSNGGWVMSTDRMASYKLTQTEIGCEDKTVPTDTVTCEPDIFATSTSISTYSNVMLYGPGSIASSTEHSGYSLNAVGTGFLNTNNNVHEYSGIVGDAQNLSTVKFSEKVKLIGTFTYSSGFIHK